VLTLIQKKIKRPMLINLRMKVSLILAQALTFLLLMWFHLPKKRVKRKKKKIQFSWNLHDKMKTILQTGLSYSRIKTATMKNNAAVTIDVIVMRAVLRVLEVALSLAMDTSSMDSETSALLRIADAKNAIKIANKTTVAKISILKKSAKRRKSVAKRRMNVANLNAKSIAVMIIKALAAGAKSLMSKTFLILRTKEGQYQLSIK